MKTFANLPELPTQSRSDYIEIDYVTPEGLKATKLITQGHLILTYCASGVPDEDIRGTFQSANYVSVK